MHDTVWFEIHGIPAVAVTSVEFKGAATVQAEALGLPEAKHLEVPHPIQDATADEMRGKADGVVDEIIEALCGAGRS